jgi:hypothetical protein
VETPIVEPATQDNSLETLKAAIEEIDAQRTQAQALTSLVEMIAAGAARRFRRQEREAVGWKARGFENGLDDETVRSLTVPAQASNLVGAALASGGLRRAMLKTPHCSDDFRPRRPLMPLPFR